MSSNDREKEDTNTYKVLVNDEEQYSIWLNHKAIPAGWKDTGKFGPKQDCLTYIKEVWTDMTPLSLRKKMEEHAKNPPPPPPRGDPNAPVEKSLVDRLCEGEHLVEVGLRPERSAQLFKEAIDRNYVYIKFTQTKGGTELGMNLETKACEFSAADFKNQRGIVHVEGTLKLDYVRVRCIADVDLSTLEGKGHLEKITEKVVEVV